MKVGILGSGDVGKALARAFTAEGYEVMIATRDPRSPKAKELAELGVEVGDFTQTADFGDFVVLCTLWSGTENAIQSARPDNLKNKLVIDTTNPLDFSGGGPSLSLGHTDSGGEQVQRWLPDSKVVKAFNIVGNQSMYKPQFEQGPPTMFICGNDKPSKQLVTDILSDFGWEVADIGDITGARELEPMCILWVKYGRLTGGWLHALKMLQ